MNSVPQRLPTAPQWRAWGRELASSGSRVGTIMDPCQAGCSAVGATHQPKLGTAVPDLQGTLREQLARVTDRARGRAGL